MFRIGQFELRYYGLMYIAAFLTVYLLSVRRLKTEEFKYSKLDVENYLVWAIMGLMLGARLGYVLFYNLSYYLSSPLEIFLPFNFRGGFHFTGLAGMSYHGGLIGVFITSIFFCRRYSVDFWGFSELIVPSIPLGYTFGRIGNFINGELYGRATTVKWGMYFPLDMTGQLRHPSQLYEAFFEGLFIFAVLWSTRRQRRFDGFALSLYLIGYGLVRFFIEFFREPDSQIGYLFNMVTMGQLLCASMILAGTVLFLIRMGKQQG
ncbi:MAG: prolipoprotein diacylglyceryl transferase [Nitrospirota bacterium]|nr:prolipoprotein diacylglyceryl transferase [Nitrospirota bacterium]